MHCRAGFQMVGKKMNRSGRQDGEKGFSLVELLLASAILSLVLALVIMMLNSVRSTARLKKTNLRMETVAGRALEYYRSHEALPLPRAGVSTVPPPMGEVPVDAFHLDQKYRLDGWGRYMHYYTVGNDGSSDRPGEIQVDPLSAGAPAGAPQAMVVIDRETVTLLDGIVWKDRRAAAILISAGPDGRFDYIRTPGYPETFTLDSGSDDLVMAIDLNGAAMENALAELQSLSARIEALEGRFLGIDNNDDGLIDENGCQPIGYPGAAVLELQIASCDNFPYYPQGGYLPVTGEDFNCFMPSLDYMKAHYCDFTGGNCPTGYYFPEILEYQIVITGTPTNPVITRTNCGTIPADYFRIPFNRGNPQADDCHWGLVETRWGPAPAADETDADQARAFVACLFGLAPREIVDPWLNGYVWGCGEGNGCSREYAGSDPRYHRFFSAGPDGVPGTEDDIVSTF